MGWWIWGDGWWVLRDGVVGDGWMNTGRWSENVGVVE